jgi:hypothetical protein
MRFLSVQGLAAVLLFAPAALAQPATPLPEDPPAVSESLFASFPVPRLDIVAGPMVWPARIGFADDARARGVIIDYEPPYERPAPVQLSTDLAPRPPSGFRGVEKLLSLAGEERETLVLAEGVKACVVPVQLIRPGDTETKPFKAAMTFQFVSASSVGEMEGTALVAAQRTTFSLLDPFGGGAARGTALVMPGLLGTPPGTVDALVRMLRDQGWAVLRMWAQPSRFTQTVSFDIDLSADAADGAKTISGELTDRLAECAYAVQGAFDHVEKARPQLASLPRVAVGFSGGALTMPTVVAREPDRYAAVVMVGGGADAFLLTLKTSYAFVGGPKYNFTGGEPTNDSILRIDEEYLRITPLDPYHCARLLRGKPMLMICGNADTAVASPLGNLLWQQAGEPTRVIRESGHEALFFSLASEFPRIRDFLADATGGASK